MLTADSLPVMEPEGLALFRDCLRSSRVYLEYGCGASTLLAARAGTAQIFSVDTDARWVGEVQQVHATLGGAARLHVQHCDVGPVGDWGVPLGETRIHRFHTYPAAPWLAARAADCSPDLVLVDGRFRVACLLYALASARPGTTLLFDDYAERPEYHVVLEFAEPVAFAGRMARFEAAAPRNLPRLLDRFAEYVLVSR